MADVNLHEARARGRKAAALAAVCLKHGVSPEQLAGSTPTDMQAYIAEAGIIPPSEAAWATTLGILEAFWPILHPDPDDQGEEYEYDTLPRRNLGETDTPRCLMRFEGPGETVTCGQPYNAPIHTEGILLHNKGKRIKLWHRYIGSRRQPLAPLGEQPAPATANPARRRLT